MGHPFRVRLPGLVFACEFGVSDDGTGIVFFNAKFKEVNPPKGLILLHVVTSSMSQTLNIWRMDSCPSTL